MSTLATPSRVPSTRAGVRCTLLASASTSRGKVADALTLDAVIDDRPENCLDVATDSSATPILIWRLRPELVPAGLARTRIEPVFSFAEALAKLEQLTAERGRRRGLLGRLRSAFSRQ